MNPEEGELRPQLLDRFGLTVEVAASRDADQRVEVVRRRLAYDADPAGFAARWADADAELRARGSRRPGRCCPHVTLPRRRAAPDRRGVRGVRRRRHARRPRDRPDGGRARRVGGADAVTEEDVRAAARLALPHRRRRDPFDEPGLDEDELDEALDARPGPEPDGPTRTARRRPDGPGPDGRPRARAVAAPEPGRRAPDTPANGTSAPRSRPRRSPARARPHAAARGDGPTQAAPRRRRRRSAPGGSRSRGIGEGAPGRRSRARTDARPHRPAPRPPRPRRGAAPARHRRRRRAAPARPRPQRRRAAPAARRPAPGRAGGPRGQPRAVRRRRLRLDGRAAADGRGQRRGAVAAARRLPAPGQGRPDHLPGHRRRARASADVQRPGRAGPARDTAHRRPHPARRRACCARAACWPPSACATRAGAPCSSC